MCRSEMIHIVLILLMSVSYAVSDHCVRYTFEENYEEWLNNQWGNGACFSNSHPHWIADKYSNIDLSPENDQSTTFITPKADEHSCVTSFPFTMHQHGKIEVNFYMEKNTLGNNYSYVAVIAYLYRGGFIQHKIIMAADISESGWHTLTMTLTREGSYEGNISIMGYAAPDSTVLVDSFRYIPPNTDENDCRLYKDVKQL